VAGALLLASLLLQRQERFRKYSEVLYLFFVAAFVFFITTITAGVRDQALATLHITVGTSFGMAANKWIEAALTITTIVVLTRVRGFSLGSIYLQRGNLKWGLIIGLGFMVNFFSSALMFFSGRFSTPDLLGSAMLWGLVFSLANGFMEELWLRGLFLRRLEPLLGGGGAILLTATWWSLMHAGAYYFTPMAIPFFLANLLTFGVAYGYAMRKTDSLIAPGFMHAASDFFLFIATLANA
jgi:membrane protease YdiL (CAAX protease family)